MKKKKEKEKKKKKSNDVTQNFLQVFLVLFLSIPKIH